MDPAQLQLLGIPAAAANNYVGAIAFNQRAYLGLELETFSLVGKLLATRLPKRPMIFGPGATDAAQRCFRSASKKPV